MDMIYSRYSYYGSTTLTAGQSDIAFIPTLDFPYQQLPSDYQPTIAVKLDITPSTYRIYTSISPWDVLNSGGGIWIQDPATDLASDTINYALSNITGIKIECVTGQITCEVRV